MMNRFLNWFRKKHTPESFAPEMMPDLIKMLDMTDTNEVSCDEVFEVLAEFAEMKQRGEDVNQFMPLIQKHIDMCSDCGEEYEALMDILNAEQQLLA
jgi:hypothetical protein